MRLCALEPASSNIGQRLPTSRNVAFPSLSENQKSYRNSHWRGCQTLKGSQTIHVIQKSAAGRTSTSSIHNAAYSNIHLPEERFANSKRQQPGIARHETKHQSGWPQHQPDQFIFRPCDRLFVEAVYASHPNDHYLLLRRGTSCRRLTKNWRLSELWI